VEDTASNTKRLAKVLRGYSGLLRADGRVLWDGASPIRHRLARGLPERLRQRVTLTDLAKPVLYWTPIVAPGNLIFYDGKMFPQWKGSALVSGLASRALIRVVATGATAKGAERWDVGHRIRDVEVGGRRRALDARRQQFGVTPK
jgi:hypothetical protein